jgi:hypothetical protein
MRILLDTTTLRQVAGDDVLEIRPNDDETALLFIVKNEAGIIYITADQNDFLLHRSDDEPGSLLYRVGFHYGVYGDANSFSVAVGHAKAQCLEVVAEYAQEMRAKQKSAYLQQKIASM